MSKPTISIRKAHSLKEELWLNALGQWGSFENRKRFSDHNVTALSDAEAFVHQHLGDNFEQYGLFPNS